MSSNHYEGFSTEELRKRAEGALGRKKHQSIFAKSSKSSFLLEENEKAKVPRYPAAQGDYRSLRALSTLQRGARPRKHTRGSRIPKTARLKLLSR